MIFQILIFVAAFLLAVLCFKLFLNPVKPANLEKGQICFGQKCFQVELAQTPEQREYGLMNRSYLDANAGMLFIFDKQGIYPFWMKNTLIPLDIIWIDNSGKVVFIKENAQPCTNFLCPNIIPTSSAKYVLELNAGICNETGIKLGDQLKIPAL